ncbi:unnamed protein product [Sphenostylis stenocarpa]|uniref:Uncharacterized protein n=1 Tax=Sphenostylis stenocarpa TaxID=92480 RepID=A0AA86SRT9_9FABA|nr:unnamed protein product [Sphenostylis stenocarpa]
MAQTPGKEGGEMTAVSSEDYGMAGGDEAFLYSNIVDHRRITLLVQYTLETYNTNNKVCNKVRRGNSGKLVILVEKVLRGEHVCDGFRDGLRFEREDFVVSEVSGHVVFIDGYYLCNGLGVCVWFNKNVQDRHKRVYECVTPWRLQFAPATHAFIMIVTDECCVPPKTNSSKRQGGEKAIMECKKQKSRILRIAQHSTETTIQIK